MNREMDQSATSTWEAALAVFDAVRDLSEEECEQRLETLCCDDAALRAEVQSLLNHHREAHGEFLNPHEAGPTALRAVDLSLPDPLIGRAIGSYTIRSLIARGGMGAVYLAEQERPRREVAIKIMTAGIWFRSAQRRFEFETEILGRLHHPSIAQVYMAGVHKSETGAPVPFFVMEYIPSARPITAYCDEQFLDLRARLQLFCQVCDGVHYGHQKGVIHRDLKPVNVLVDAHSHVKIIDFGIARSTDSDIAVTTMHTEAGQLLGTLAYMSPEQCAAGAGDIDTRADVYSLGVVLFELLTGRLPYDVSHMTIHAATRVICEQEPAKPSQVSGSTGVSPSRLRGDLDTIIFKCLEKDRAKRYTSAAALAEDIQRYLRGEPISARSPTSFERLLRWATKHPTRASAAASFAVVLAIVLSSSLTFYLLGRKPDRIEISRDRREVRLMTMGGIVLHRWVSGGAASIHFAELMVQPDEEEFDGRRLAIIAFENGSATKPGMLCAYDIDGSWEQPYWEKRIEESHLTDIVRNMGPKDWTFSPRAGIIADVFPQSPGPEIAVVFTHVRSHCALCIYDSHGTLLYRIWQDGGIHSFCWLSGPGILVCAGADERVKDSLQQHGVKIGPILFALRPESGFTTRKYLRAEGDHKPDAPVWYKYIRPAVAPGVYYLAVSSTVGVLNPDRFFLLNLVFELQEPEASVKDTGTVYLIVNEHGNIMPGSVSASDSFNAHRQSLPPLEIFELSNNPPTVADIWRPDR